MGLELVVAAIMTAILLLPLAIVGSVPVLAYYVLGLIVALGIVAFNMRKPRPWVRWAGAAVQAGLAAFYVLRLIVDPTLGSVGGLGLTVAAVVLLLVPSSAAWFGGSARPARWLPPGPGRT
ncbi:hypothetical protein ACBI99_18760 [Nonomuraea sp. ATR24]|uniref:hypothetical protein n=1 Tax=Nonomuraea TaxID=83681 RepID=UPI001C5E1E90|nr:hypothetical protein [Nonomuraea ceibae]